MHASSGEDAKLKQIFRDGWNHPGRVKAWANHSVSGEFNDPACRDAWRRALGAAMAGMNPTNVTEAADMGTGPGAIAQFWAEFGLQTTGVDFSGQMLVAASNDAKTRGLHIEFVEGDVEQAPFAESRFAVISSRLVLFTLPHPGHAVRRWVQLLRPAGRLVLIGEEHNDGADRPRPPKPDDNSPPTRPPGAWQADETYRDALRQLPFVNHTESMLRVVMEAAGLSQIRSVPMDAVVAAREALIRQSPTYRVFPSKPYILIGCNDR
jgi:ubiquinone/menaquinone biosynthesis C-methylase UbiE